MTKQTQILLDKLARWAKTNPDIIGLALVGSHARGQARQDSDIDFILLASRPEDFVGDPNWIRQFGRVNSFEIEKWGTVTSLRVYYEQGLEVEYGLASLHWVSSPIEEGTRKVISDGIKILVDKHGLLGQVAHERSS